MQCRTCGTEIAEKAIVCYRCGTATTDPVRSPVPVRRRGRGGPPLAGAAVLLVLAVVLLFLAPSYGHPDGMTAAAGASALAGVVLLIARLLRRR